MSLMLKQVNRVNRVWFIGIIIVASLLAACAPDIATVTPKQAAEMLSQQKAIIVDVRENDEWQEQHITGAIHIPLDQVQARIAELAQYKNNTVIMQCRSGKRSEKAAKILKTAGFSSVYNLKGGILAWDNAGLQTNKPIERE